MSSGRVLCGRIDPCRLLGTFHNPRQPDGERRAAARFALDGDITRIIWQNRLLIASPSPVPPYLRVVEASA
jgi:hypothetical protein